MLTRTSKAMFYAVAGPLMKINGWIYRNLRVAGVIKATPVRLHLGPGTKAYLPGWTNIDANIFTAKCDIWLDLRNPLPFPDGTVDAVYSHHMIEHLPITGTDHAELFMDCMAKEHERTPEAPHTLLLEMQKSA